MNKPLAVGLAVVTAPVWLPLVVFVAAAYLVTVAILYVIVWTWWIGFAERRVLFVYSDSPLWKDHVEQRILPRLPRNTVVLNWSQRLRWPRLSLAVLLFHTFAGGREFNPIALVFERFAFVDRFRFWQPFRDAKHGKVEPLASLESALVERLQR